MFSESGKAAAFFLFECNAEIQGLGEPEIFSVSFLYNTSLKNQISFSNYQFNIWLKLAVSRMF